MKLLLLAVLAAATAFAAPTVSDPDKNVEYVGFERNGVEVFLGIPYAQDTGGQNRFKPPQPYVPAPGTVFNATIPGHACPQQLGQWNTPLTLLNVTKESISEDCLNLNIVRPIKKQDHPSLSAVMVWIHGGSFWVGSNMEPTHVPDSLVKQAADEGVPIIHVAINYRLGFFGFAQSGALREEHSENAGLRDQRLAIEWVRDNIEKFGGDPNRITIHGQSSGGLAVGMQLLAYGGEKELPYQFGICQSQALEPGITGNFTRNAMIRLVEHVGCAPANCSDSAPGVCNSKVDAPEVIECLREKDMQTLFDASAATYTLDNIGDIWLPSVDGDFLPDTPSKLIEEGRFGNASYMLGWTQDDVNWFTNISIRTEDDTIKWLNDYLPNVSPEYKLGQGSHLTELYLKLYEDPAEFNPPPGTNLTSEFYRTARVFRDILMVCEPLLLAKAIHEKKGRDVYLYNFNQTLLDPLIESAYGVKGMGVVHTSEFPYIFGNPSVYKTAGYPSNPTEADYSLAVRSSRSWASFAYQGNPVNNLALDHRKTLEDWHPAFWKLEEELPRKEPTGRKPGHTYVYTIGGPEEGLKALEEPGAHDALKSQNLEERCGFFNDPEFIRRLGF